MCAKGYVLSKFYFKCVNFDINFFFRAIQIKWQKNRFNKSIIHRNVSVLFLHIFYICKHPLIRIVGLRSNCSESIGTMVLFEWNKKCSFVIWWKCNWNDQNHKSFRTVYFVIQWWLYATHLLIHVNRLPNAIPFSEICLLIGDSDLSKTSTHSIAPNGCYLTTDGATSLFCRF